MIEKAKDLIRQKQCSVAVVTARGEVLTDTGSSVRPLLRLYAQHREDLHDAAVADKIIGRAAACILCEARVREVFAFVMSQSGKELLDRYHIPCAYETMVPFIANMRGDDLCPMEKTVEGLDDLMLCVERLQDFVRDTVEPKFAD